MKPGRWFLIACADGAKRVAESNERNNCPRSGAAIGVRPRQRTAAIRPELAAASRAEGVIGAQGGSISAVLGDTMYILNVPAGGVGAPTRIAITPLQAAGGLPVSGGLIAGAQLAPEGLELIKPAWLAIIRPGLAPGADQVAFGWHGPGTGFHLTPFAPALPPAVEALAQAGAIVVPVLHFSGSGLAQGRVAAELLALEASRVEDALGERVARERSCQGAPACSPKSIEEITHRAASDFVRQVLLPKAIAAKFSLDLLRQAMAARVSLTTYVNFLGVEEFETRFEAELAHIDALIEAGWKEAFKRAQAKCLRGDPGGIGDLLSIARQRIITGNEDFSEALDALLPKCVRLELRVKSRIIERASGPGFSDDGAFTLEASVPVSLSSRFARLGGQGELSGEGPLTYTEVSFTSTLQTDFLGIIRNLRATENHTGQTTPSVLRVLGGTIRFFAGENANEDIADDVRFLVDPGLPQEQIAFRRTGESLVGPFDDSGTEMQSRWRYAWSDTFHRPDALQVDDGPWLIDGFTAVQGVETIARRTYTIERAGGGSLVETWELVRKAPG